MRTGIGCAVVLASLTFAVADAAADTLCVPNTSIPGCPASAANEPTIGDAVTNGHNGDTILIGADSFNGSHPYNETVDDTGKAFVFRGAGVGKTIIQGQGVAAMTLSAGSSVSDLTIDLANGPGNTGLMLAGTATHVAVIATQPASTKNNIGVDLTGGTFAHGSVTLPVTGANDFNYGGVIGSGTVADSSITAAVGITDDSVGATPAVHRDTIVANQGVLIGTAPFSIDDSVIRTVPGASPELGIGLPSNLINGDWTARHVDLIGSGAVGSVGASVRCDGIIGPTTSDAILRSSIVRGYATSVSATANGGPFAATATFAIGRTFYDTTRASTTQTGVGVATVSKDATSGNIDPLFVSPTNLHLAAGSPAIDAGDPPPLGSGESATDLDGHPRVVAGRKGDQAISDVGAYEFQPRAPTVSASASATRVQGFKAIRFTATGSDASPGDVVSFTWRFDDGATATGASVTHAFKAGRHTATVTATDLDRFTSSAKVTVTVIGPALSKLRIKRGHHATTLTYRDTQAATTTLKVFRVGSKLPLRTLTHHDKAGKNRLKLGSLKPGRYRLVAVPRNRAGRGKPITVRFRLI